MIVTVGHITEFLEIWAPSSIKLSYDNIGLQAGSFSDPVSGVITTLDLTEEVIEEAIQLKANLIIAHHPIIFPTISSVNTSTPVGRLLTKLIKNDINLFVSHTNLDSVKGGVSFVLAEKLGLLQTDFLTYGEGKHLRLEGFAPSSKKADLNRLFQMNKSKIYYSSIEEQIDTFTLSFSVIIDAQQLGSFQKELNLLTDFAVVKSELKSKNEDYGFGAVGFLPKPLAKNEFLELVCSSLAVESFRFTGTKETIEKVAVSGGSGSSLISKAISKQADAYITSDIKYHDYFISNSDLLVLDIGHFETERFISKTLKNRIEAHFTQIPVFESRINTNPIKVFISQNQLKNAHK